MRGLIAAEKFYGTKKKKLAILFAVIAILLTGVMVFPGSLSSPKNSRIKKEIQTLLAAYNAFYQKKDLEGIMEMYSTDSGTIMLGAGREDFSIGHGAIRDAYQKEFSAFSGIQSVEYGILSLYISGDIATLAAERCITAERGDEVVRMAGGFTAVLKKDEGRWVFIQTHFPQLSERPPAGKMPRRFSVFDAGSNRKQEMTLLHFLHASPVRLG